MSQRSLRSLLACQIGGNQCAPSLGKVKLGGSQQTSHRATYRTKEDCLHNVERPKARWQARYRRIQIYSDIQKEQKRRARQLVCQPTQDMDLHRTYLIPTSTRHIQTQISIGHIWDTDQHRAHPRHRQEQDILSLANSSCSLSVGTVLWKDHR